MHDQCLPLLSYADTSSFLFEVCKQFFSGSKGGQVTH